MLNRKFYRIERNNYYYGKLLTSKDFQEEQRYLNGKRRFGNRTLQGVGIVKGLHVVMADDTSIILQAGFALDAAGREIVVPETEVIKISTIDGFSELATDCAYLGIAYDEKPSDPVYSAIGIDSASKGQSYNRVKEGYHLYLLDEKDCAPIEKEEETFLQKTVMYQDEDVKVTQISPKFALKGKKLKVKVIIEKLSHAASLFSIKYNLEALGFLTRDVEVVVDNLALPQGKTHVLEYTILPEDYVFGSQELQLLTEDIVVQKAEKKDNLKVKTVTLIDPILTGMEEYILQKTQDGAMDANFDKRSDERLWIAGIHLLRSGSSAIIDGITPAPFAQYIYTVEQLSMIHALTEYFIEESNVVVGNANTPSHEPALQTAKADAPRIQSSGVFEMSFGNGGEAGRKYISDEIMHGLGVGAVFVEVGIEYLKRDANTKKSNEEIILGDNSIFATEDNHGEEKIHFVDTAIKILPDRGTFIVGVRPKAKTGKMSLRIRWYAFKTEDIQQRVSKAKDQAGCLMMQPDTIVLAPKEVAHINPVFINMPEEALSYTLIDPEGGKVDHNGVYTAPAQEGVYEVKAACISNPEIFTHAFMIVSQKRT